MRDERGAGRIGAALTRSHGDEPADLLHDLANAIGALLLGLDLLTDEIVAPDPAADTVADLHRQAATASTLVTRLQHRLDPDRPDLHGSD